jgi:hypothetical protein
VNVDNRGPVLLKETTHLVISADVVDTAPECVYALDDRVLQNSARFHDEPRFMSISREHSRRGINYHDVATDPGSSLVINL